MKEIFDLLAKELPENSTSSSQEKAYVLMALLAGGAILTRTVLDPELSERISVAVQSFAVRLAGKC